MTIEFPDTIEDYSLFSFPKKIKDVHAQKREVAVFLQSQIGKYFASGRIVKVYMGNVEDTLFHYFNVID